MVAASPVLRAACVDPNTCFGTGALESVTTGSVNSGFGYQALLSNTEGSYNTAAGYQALVSNTSGFGNTALGATALVTNTTGGINTAAGYGALYHNTTGSSNTATGFSALSQNSTGNANVASGFLALSSNTTGVNNTASGAESLANNLNGRDNTATGHGSLSANRSGRSNTADGRGALENATGHRNVGLGDGAGSAITTGSDNIVIGAGTHGRADDNGVIRIGIVSRQKKTLIAGIRGVTTGAANAVPVVIDSKGQLGTISSSRRFKEDILPMGATSERLYALQPVTFHYRQADDDGRKPLQFGLVAEDVAERFPELVVYGEDGAPETVSYHVLGPLLLNELQKQHRLVEDQAARIAALEAQAAHMAQMLARFERAQPVVAAAGR